MKVALIYYYFLHKCTKGSAEAVDADFYKLSGSNYSLINLFQALWMAIKMPDYDIYFTEGAWSLWVPWFKRLFGKKFIHIYRCNNPIFSEEYYLSRLSWFKRKIIKMLLRNIDGVIAVSEMVAEDVKKFGKPYKIAYSFIDTKRFIDFRPNLNTHNFVVLGYAPYKALDITIKIFLLLKEKYKDAKLFIGGNIKPENLIKHYGHHDWVDKEKAKQMGIFYTGFKEDVTKQFRGKTYYLTTPWYEPGPTAVLEAMACGLVCIINNNTGHKDIIKKVNKKLIIPEDLMDKKSYQTIRIVKHIENIIENLDNEKISHMSRNIAKNFNKHERQILFRMAFNDLIKDIKRK